MISISIVTYNISEFELRRVVSCVLSSSLAINRLYIVDNSPIDRISQCIIDSKIEYIFNPTNPGYGAAHNIALKKSIENNISYHLVLNPDVIFENDVLEKIYIYMEASPMIANLMPRVLYVDGTMQFLCKLLPTPYDWIGRRFNPFRKMVDKRNDFFELHFTGYNRIMDVPYLSGCFMFLRIQALKKVGLFDENIFMYGEETDLCRRLIKGGYKTVFFPEVSIVHEFQKGSHKTWRLTWIGIKSAIYYFNKWGWFFDMERRKINKETLKKFGYKK